MQSQPSWSQGDQALLRPRKGDAAREARSARVFFALWPDAAVARRLHTLSGEAHAACGGRRMQRDTLHITLAFIGDIPRERLPDLHAVGDLVEPARFTLGLDRLGGWRHNRIVWAGTGSVPDPLAALVSRFKAALEERGFPVEQRPFAPHVTLLRKSREAFPERAIDPVVWPVAGFVLVESERTSEGAHYKVIGEWRAAGEEGA